MENHTESVEQHYSVGGLLESIYEALRTMGKDINHLTPDDLAPVDAFHLRGREATVELAQLAEIRAEVEVRFC